MKKLILALVAPLLFMVSSCNDDTITPSNNNNNNNTYSYIGYLNVKVLDPSHNVMSGTAVYVYRTYEDLKNNYALMTKVTGSDGKAKFGEILEGNYYVRTGDLIFSTWYADTGVVQIISGNTTDRDMILH